MSLLTSLNIPANTLPVFLSYNTFWTSGGCCILGYHSTNNAGTQAYAVAAYSDPGIFSVPIQDIHVASHEFGEWLDDPLIPNTNIVPAWGHVGQVGGCQNNLETGDPVTGKAFTISVGGTAPFTYHPEDLVFLPWFARISPSTSVNGWFTFLNGFNLLPVGQLDEDGGGEHDDELKNDGQCHGFLPPGRSGAGKRYCSNFGLIRFSNENTSSHFACVRSLRSFTTMSCSDLPVS